MMLLWFDKYWVVIKYFFFCLVLWDYLKFNGNDVNEGIKDK